MLPPPFCSLCNVLFSLFHVWKNHEALLPSLYKNNRQAAFKVPLKEQKTHPAITGWAQA
ncbi:hypothetical protein B14911_05721 [Bacillus sp. NRRL B-14911]|nr:hypothetical protein B14911_05721 [Bacillus sp. NRRL B-14911]